MTLLLSKVRHLRQSLVCNPSDRLDVSQADYDGIDEERERRRLKFRFFFLAKERQLRVTLPSGPHELTHAGLFGTIWTNMVSPSRMPPWYPCAAKIYKSPDGTSSKEADSGGFPGGGDTSGGDSRWPTLVIECGASQSVASLHAAMRWWFWASEHRVKIVLAVKLHRSRQTMVIEKFVEAPIAIPRLGATATRSSVALPHLQPLLQQTITVAPVPDSNPVEYRATSGALVLAFELLYRRPPGPSPGERDVVVPESELEALAGHVWD